MHNDKSGASAHHPEDQEDGAVLSPAEVRGRDFKRYARAAAAMSELYDDATLARAIRRSRMAVQGWWRGARPDPEVLYRLEAATGLSAAEVIAWLYSDGPPPTWPLPADSEVVDAIREAVRRDRDRRQPADSPAPPPSPRQRTPGGGAGSA